MLVSDLLMVSYAIVTIAVAVIVAASIAYYQFFYISGEETGPVSADLPDPSRTTTIKIIRGASDPNNPEFLVPKVAVVVIGMNNTVQWVNEDVVPHTVTSDTRYTDPISGDFNILTQVEGGFILGGKTFEFTFTEPGEYGYHGEPHPWIQGTIIVKEP
jgi:plastocyanin